MAKGAARKRKTSKQVAQSPGCKPLKDAYEEAVRVKPTSWDQVQDTFLRAMELFDRNVEGGRTDWGDRQNGKGDFFNDLLALILEKCADVELLSRSGVPGFVFPSHNLDVTYPATGIVQFLLEAKAVGIPKHPGNPKQKNPLGRDGSADLPKRIKEGAFKTIDLKSEYARMQSMVGKGPKGGPGGDLTTWLRSSKPLSYLFIAARVTSTRDHNALLNLAHAAHQVWDRVGVFSFRPVSEDKPTTYEALSVPRDIELAAVLFSACQDLINVPPVEEVEAPPGPAEEAASLIDEEELEAAEEDE